MEKKPGRKRLTRNIKTKGSNIDKHSLFSSYGTSTSIYLCNNSMLICKITSKCNLTFSQESDVQLNPKVLLEKRPAESRGESFSDEVGVAVQVLPKRGRFRNLTRPRNQKT